METLQNKRLAFVFLLTLFSFAPAEAVNFEEADESYRVGNCPRAIELYTQITVDPQSNAQTLADAWFKIAYCEYSDGKFAAAENAFSNSLFLDPKNSEAQFRYLDSVFQQGKWNKVILYAQKLSFHAQKSEILLMAGRAYLELSEPEKALEQFHQMNPSPDLLPSQQYWMGVAEFQRGDQLAAMTRFQYAIGGAFAPEWVRSYAQEWLNALKRDAKPFYGAMTLGFFSDGNVSSSSTGVSDTGYLVNTRFGGTLRNDHPWKLLFAFDFSSPLYSTQSAYNNQNTGFELRGIYTKNSKESYRLAARVLDSRYRFIYYQNYLILTPGMTWTPRPRFIFNFDLPITRYIVSRTATLIGPLINARYQWLPWLSLNAGLNLSKAIGESAIYSGPVPLFGTPFSNYLSVGGTLGFLAELPLGFYLTSQASYYKTTYDPEAVTFTGTQQDPGVRNDALWVMYADLYKPITERWAIDLAFHFYSNQSEGFQGVAFSTQNFYTYQKPYWLLSNTFQF